jgi:hypothetical protein
LKLIELEYEREFKDFPEEERKFRVRTAMEEKAEPFNELAKKVFKQLEKKDDIDLPSLNTEILKLTTKAGIKDAEKKIAKAKDLMTLGDKQYHIATIHMINGKAVLESSVMLLPSGNKDSNNIHAGDYATIAEKRAEKVGVNWYDALPDYQKKIIKEHAEAIAEGRVMLNNQVRTIAGVRQGYQTTLYQVEKGNSLKTIATTLHAGALSHHGAGDAVETTARNINQVQGALGGVKLTVNILNSPSPLSIFDADNEIEERVRLAQKRPGTNGDIFLTPTNPLRFIAKNSNGEVSQVLAKIAPHIQNEPILMELLHHEGVTQSSAMRQGTALIEFLQKGGNEKKYNELKEALEKSVNNVKDEAPRKLGIALLHAVELQYRSNQRKGIMDVFRDSENQNAQIAAHYKLLNSYINDHKVFGEMSVSPVLTHCKSGKDRTGAVEALTRVLALEDFMRIAGKEITPETRNKIAADLIKGSNLVIASGMNGGSPGCLGIKSGSMSSIPKHLQEGLGRLHNKNANNNAFKVKPKPAVLPEPVKMGALALMAAGACALNPILGVAVIASWGAMEIHHEIQKRKEERPKPTSQKAEKATSVSAANSEMKKPQQVISLEEIPAPPVKKAGAAKAPKPRKDKIGGHRGHVDKLISVRVRSNADAPSPINTR